MKKQNYNVGVILIGILATIFFCYPYLNHLDIAGHDLEFHLARIQQISISLSHFKIPVLIHQGLAEGLGYGNSIFYPELFLYFPAILHLAGISTITSYKIFIIVLTFFTYLSMYATSKKISQKTSVGIIAALLYTLSLYRIVDVYTRAALGEVIAFTFAPLVLFGLYELVYGNEKKWWILPLGIFGIVNSHIISFGLTVLFILLFLAIGFKEIFKDKSRLKYVFISGVVSILLSMSIFLPIAEQAFSNDYKVFTNGTSEELSTKSLLITQIFMNEYKDLYCKTNEVVNNQMNFGNGVLLLLLPLFIFIAKFKKTSIKKFIWTTFITGFIILVVTSVIFPWQYFRVLNFIQLPWRFNIIITLCFSMVGAYCFYQIVEKKDSIYILAIIIVLVTSGYLDKVTYTDNRATEQEYTSIGQGEYLPAIGYNRTENYVFDVNNHDLKYNYEKENGIVKFKLTKKQNSKKISVPFIYYKGYTAYIKNNGKTEKLDVSMNNNGMVLVNNKDLKTGDVTVKYKMTTIQKLSYLITYGTLFTTVGFIVADKKKKGKK